MKNEKFLLDIQTKCDTGGFSHDGSISRVGRNTLFLHGDLDQSEGEISKSKENLASCTLNVVLFPEQGVEIRSLQHEMHAHPVRISFCSVSKNFID